VPLVTGSGNPGTLVHAPGVVNKKLKVVSVIKIAPVLPTADISALKKRSAIKIAKMISAAPMTFETACTLKTEYIHDINGLFEISGSMAFASNVKNLAKP